MDNLQKRSLLLSYWAAQEKGDLPLFIKRNLFIRTKAGPIIPFRMNPIQRYYLSLKQKTLTEGRPARFLVLKYRRGGISTFEQADSFHRVCSREGQHAVTLAHDANTTDEIFRISSLFYERMDPIRRPRRKTKNKRELDFPALTSKFYTGTAGTEGFGRGATLQKVHGSEVAKWPGGIRSVSDLMGGLTEASTDGEIVLESTANGMGNWFQKTYRAAKKEKGKGEWTPIFLAWFMDPINQIPLEPGERIRFTREEKNLIEKNKAFFIAPKQQINWARKKRAALKIISPDDDLFPQEYPENWVSAFIATGQLYFSHTILQGLMDTCREALSKEELKAAGCPKDLLDNVQVWHLPESGMKCFIGADASDGIPGLDASHAGVLDLNGRQCASLHGYWEPEVFGRKLVSLARWYNKALLAIENAEAGHAVLATVQNECKYPRIYYHLDYDARSGRPKVGWNTNSKTRVILLTELREAVHQGYMEVNQEDFIAECFTFVNWKDKWQARQGDHDDSIFGWGIAWQARKKGSQSVGYRELGDRPDMPPEEKDSEKNVDGPGFIALKVE